MALPNPPPLALECFEGPLDGDIIAWQGVQVVQQSGEVLHVYDYCERGHYHYEGAYLRAARTSPTTRRFEP